MLTNFFNDRRLRWCIGLALLMLVLAIASANTVIDLDLFHEMALFREMLSLGTMPTTDSFAYTPTIDTVVHHEWGTGAVLYLSTVGVNLGAGGLMSLKYLATFGLCIGSFLLARKSGGSFVVIACLAPIALNLGGWIAFSTVRATLFTLCFLMIQYFLLRAEREGKSGWLWIWLPMVVVWANLHGGVVAGLGIFGLYCLTQFGECWIKQRSFATALIHKQRLIVGAVLTPLMLLINPYGWQYVPYLIRAVRMKRPLIGEWRPIWESASIVTPTLFVLSLLIAAASLYFCLLKTRENKPDERAVDRWELLFPALAIALTAYLAAKHIRHVSLYAVTWICFVPAMTELSSIGDSIKDLYKRNTIGIGVATLLMAVVSLGFSVEAKFWELQVPTVNSQRLRGAPLYPVAAVEYLKDQEFNGNLMVPFANGAYVSWKLYPHVKVSIDSRYEVAYPHGAVEESVAFYRAKETWRSTLERYPTDAVLVRLPSPLESKFSEAREKHGSEEFPWQEVYRDESFCIYANSNRLPNIEAQAKNGIAMVATEMAD